MSIAVSVSVLACASPAGDDLHIDNQTTIPTTIRVNGNEVATAAPHGAVVVGAVQLPSLPWAVDVATASGRTLVQLNVTRPSDVSGSGDHVVIQGSAARVDLSCGRIDVWVGPPLAGPPPGPGTPGDCDP